MSGSISYSFSAPANTNITITIGNPVTSVTTSNGSAYSGYAITGVSGTINGSVITGLIAPGGVTNSNVGAGTFDNTVFVNNTQGDNGRSVDGIDDEGFGFTTQSGVNYRIFYAFGAFQYQALGVIGFTTLTATNEPSVVCFAAGTRLLTPSGETPIETLKIGDLVITARGEARPIVWIGHRTIDCARHANPSDAYPVRIAAGAFSDGRPSHDLLLSPGHAVCVDLLGEVLIPASALVNGATITQEAVDKVIYWHVELETHDVLVAEGLPAESYLDVGNRNFFDSALVAPTEPLDPSSSDRDTPNFCRPAYCRGPVLDVARMQLRRRAFALGWTIDAEPFSGMHLTADGARIEPLFRGNAARFVVPAGARDIWLICRGNRPCDVGSGEDARRLGFCFSAIVINDGFDVERRIAPGDPRLDAGCYEVEDNVRRWTSGSLRLDPSLWEGYELGFILRIDFACPTISRWIMPGFGQLPAAVQLAIERRPLDADKPLSASTQVKQRAV